MTQKTESGRTLLETIAVLVVIAILLLASIVGYNVIVHQWRKHQTVKQISELAIRYKLRPIQPREGKVDIKPVFPEAERANAVEMKTADTDTGRVSLITQDVSVFSVVVNNILSDSCEATLENGGYDSVLWKDGLDEYQASEEYLVIGENLLKNWDNVSNDKKPENLRGKTKKEVIAYLCHADGSGKIHNMSLVFGDKCPKMGASYWYSGRCWSCPSNQTEDEYGKCCTETNECGVCKCPETLPICDKDGSGKCVECLLDEDCEGNRVCSPEHKCEICRPYTQDGCTDGKWCSSWYKCEECLENYDADKTDEGYRCAADKALCDKTEGLEKWHCGEWPCAQNLFLTTCQDGESGSITKGGKCSEDVCRCAAGLECQPGEEGQCSTCQCIDEAPEGLVAPAEGRQKGQACNTDGTCPCGKNELGIDLLCVDNVCSCLDNGQVCGVGTDCCSGYCNSEGKCGPEPGSCQKLEYETECSTDSTDLEHCCSEGSCQSIRGEQICCKGNGLEGAECSSNLCCDTGLTCDTGTGKCVPETSCSDGGSCDTLSCCSGQNCITRSDSGDKTCCPSDETGEIGAKCTDNNCCNSGLCEDEDGDGEGVCSEACAGHWIGEGSAKTCCENTGENGTICTSNACCNSGKCVKADATDETGICCQTDDSDGADCSNALCCASGKCTNNKCCPAVAPVEGETCTVACGCAEGYNCNPDTLTCVPPTCVNTEEDRQQENATCSEYCPCGVSDSGEQMTCGSDGKCHTCTSGFWRRAEGKLGACCPVAEGLDLGSVCTNDSCCKSGNCSIGPGATEGHCCQSTYTWIRNLKDSSGGQCCASVVETGGTCSGAKDGCCQTGYCRRVYTKMEAKTTESKSYPCLKWKDHKEKCTSCHCGSCSTFTCYYSECKKYDYDHPQTTTKTSAYANKGLSGPYKCCEGDGKLGSPCSEDCPCEGTAFQYYVNGEFQKAEIKVTEYQSIECSCKKVPLLYCRPEGSGKGTCQLNPYILDTKEKSYKATAMNCAYTHNFSNSKDGKCYLCPADSSFRENSTYVACCPPSALAVNDNCARYKKSDGYVSDHVDGELYEGFYLDEKTGQMTLCSKGSYCIGGHKYPCEEGTYSDTQGATSCHYCGKGKYCPEGATKTTNCPAGFYCPEWATKRADMEETYHCAPGTYSAAGANDISGCKVCPVGSYCPGKSAAIACDGKNLPGECPEKGMEAPIEGNPGQYLKSKKLTACEAGYYCPNGFSRYACKAGTYQDKKGQAECKLAPEGVAISVSASQGPASKTAGAWIVCPAGSYAAGTGNIECTKCTSGTYQNEKGKAECKACPEGTTSTVGATKASQCAACAGDVANVSSVQTQCCNASQKVVKNEATGWETCCANSKDRYCKNKKGTYGCNSSADCALSEEEAAATACTEKQYIASGKCTACTEGYSCNGSVREQCPVGTYAAKGDGVCTKCPPGSYQDKIGQAECKVLWKKNAEGEYQVGVSNKYTDTEGSSTYKYCTGNLIAHKTHTKCVECQEGRKPNSGHSKCETVCKKGEMYDNGACRRCQQNFYCPNGWQELPCEEYKYSLPGAEKCSSCGNGKYWNSNSGKCVTCEAGNYCAAGIKRPCPEGSTSAVGATQCSTCDPGEFFNTSKKSCQPCSAGTYSAGGTVTSCTQCPAGKYQPQKGQSECLKCPAGTFNASKGQTKCTFCGEKKWYEGTGATAKNQCTSCPAGSYCTKSGVKNICPAGSKCPAGSASATACPAGSYQDQEGQTTCKNCDAGTISKAGATSCTACEAGKYTSNHTSCSKCTGTIYPTKNKDGSLDGKQTCCSSTTPKYCKKSTSASAAYGCYRETDCKVY